MKNQKVILQKVWKNRRTVTHRIGAFICSMENNQNYLFFISFVGFCNMLVKKPFSVDSC